MLSRAGLKWVYFSVLHLLREDGRIWRRLLQRELIVVLNLHKVSPQANPFWSALHPRIFEDLLVFLKSRFTVTTFRDCARSDRKRPRAILSFDDGYQNFVEYAMPLLRKHGLTANQNVIPSCVESGRPPWNVVLSDFLNAASPSLIRDLRLPGFDRRLEGTDVDSKMRYGVALSALFKNRSRMEREPHWVRIQALMDKSDAFETTRMMGRGEVREAAASHEIGAHSYTHESMEYESDEFFQDDLGRCRSYFQSQIGLPLTIYAFPNGSYRPAHLDALRGAGIQHILLVGEQFATGRDSVYPRFTIFGESSRETRFQALGYRARATLRGAQATV